MNNSKALALIHGAAEDAAYRAKYYQAHKDEKKKYNAAYYAAHKDYWKDYYKRMGLKGTVDLRSMRAQADPDYRLKLAREAKKRGDITEYTKQLRRAEIERDVRNMYEAVAEGDRAREQQEAARSAKSGQSHSGANTPFSGKKELVYRKRGKGSYGYSEFTRYSGNQKIEYALKEAANKFGSNWQSGARDLISTGKSIVSSLRSKFGF